MDTKLKVRRLAHAHGWFIGLLSWWVGDVKHVLSICHVAGKGPVPRESPRVYPCEAELIAPIHGSPFRIWTGRYSEKVCEKLHRRDERGISQVRHWLGISSFFHIFPQESGGCLFAAGDHRDFQDILHITLFKPYPINISRRPRVKYEIQPNQCNHRWCYSQIRSSIAWTTLSHLLCHYWMTSAETLKHTYRFVRHETSWSTEIWTFHEYDFFIFLCNDQVNQE